MEQTLPERLIAALGEGVATTYLKSYSALCADRGYDHTVQHHVLVSTNAMLKRMRANNTTAYEDASALLLTLEAMYSKQCCMAAAVIITLNKMAPGSVLKKLPTAMETLG